MTVAGHCVADARNRLGPYFSTSAAGGVEARSFQGAGVRDVGREFPRVAGEDRLGEKGRRLMPSLFCLCHDSSRKSVGNARDSRNVYAGSRGGRVQRSESGALAAQEPQSPYCNPWRVPFPRLSLMNEDWVYYNVHLEMHSHMTC